MNAHAIPTDLLALLEASPKRRKWFASFRAQTAALLVVDMQNHWLDERGACYIPHASYIVPQINRLAKAVRSAGGTIVWIQSSMAPEGRGAWPLFFEHLTEAGAIERAELTPGHVMHALWGPLDVQSSDCRVAKNRFSAFIAGASDLECQLRERLVDTVLVTGVATNICCESTARDAMMLDFRTVMVADANAARTNQDHVAGLRTFAQVFGAVMTVDQVIDRLE
jgi:ureidoacrylate peracid hydrolase